MADFVEDTRVEGRDGLYRCTLREGWGAWGPYGGFVATVALRAIGAHGRFSRPASLHCNFFRVAKFEPVEIRVVTLRAGRRAESLRASIVQDGKPVAEADAWLVDGSLDGLMHSAVAMPSVPGEAALKTVRELEPDKQDWSPIWSRVDAKPCEYWEGSERRVIGPPQCNLWMRLSEGCASDDSFVQAGRSLMWLDMAMWSAVEAGHGWPPSHLAPNLDLYAHFHAAQFSPQTPQQAWSLVEAWSPFAAEGLVSSQGRIWRPDGALLANGSAGLLCIANPVAQHA